MTDDASQPPEGWTWTELGSLLTDTQTGVASGEKSRDAGICHLRMNNVSIYGSLDLSHVWRIPPIGLDTQRFKVVNGDVLFNNTNSLDLVGKTALVAELDGDYVFSNHITRLRTEHNELLPEWLTLFLRYQWGRGYFARMADEWVNQANIDEELLKRMPILRPPIPQQRTISDVVVAQLRAVNDARLAAERQLTAIRAMPHSMIRTIFDADRPPIDDDEIW